MNAVVEAPAEQADIEHEGHLSGRERLQQQTTVADILRTATEFERIARDFYAELTPKVSKRIRDLVQELAEEEQGHFDLFSQLAENPDVANHIQDKIARPTADRRFTDHINPPELGEHPDDQEVLLFAINREKAAMEQYGELAESAPEGRLKEVFTFLAREETLHKQELEAKYYEIIHSGGV